MGAWRQLSAGCAAAQAVEPPAPAAGARGAAAGRAAGGRLLLGRRRRVTRSAAVQTDTLWRARDLRQPRPLESTSQQARLRRVGVLLRAPAPLPVHVSACVHGLRVLGARQHTHSATAPRFGLRFHCSPTACARLPHAARAPRESRVAMHAVLVLQDSVCVRARAVSAARAAWRGARLRALPNPRDVPPYLSPYEP